MFKNYWKYHFDNVLLGFHLLIDIACDSIRVNQIFFLFVISHSFFITIIIDKCLFLFAPRIILSVLGIESL
jgi:hypothetical protein